MAEKLNISIKTVTKSMKELEDENLIENKRMGMGKKNRIYFNEIDIKTREIIADVWGKKLHSEGQKGLSRRAISSEAMINKTDLSETDLNKPKRKKKKNKKNTLSFKLAKYLYQNILEKDENLGKPNLRVWARDMNYLLFMEHRTFSDIINIIDYAMADDFWSSCVMDSKSLRKNYSKIYIQMRNKEKNKSNSKNCGINIYSKEKNNSGFKDDLIDISSLDLRKEIEKIGLDK